MDESKYGNAPVFFAIGTVPAARRRRAIFTLIGLVAVAMLVWPLYPRFGDASPRVLGLPLFFAWVVGALALMFVNLLWLFWKDGDDPRDHAGTDEARGGR